MTILRCPECGFATDYATREDEGPEAAYSVAGFTKIDGQRPRRLTRDTQRAFYDMVDCFGYVITGRTDIDYTTNVDIVIDEMRKTMKMIAGADREKLKRLKEWRSPTQRILDEVNKQFKGAKVQKVVPAGPLFGSKK